MSKKFTKKTECPISRTEFAQLAKALPATINGQPLLIDTKEFSTGSLGWYMNGKINVPMGEEIVKVQIGLTLTVIGSKDLPKDSRVAA